MNQQPTPYDNQPLEPLPPSSGQQMAIPLSKPYVTYVLLVLIILVWIAMEIAGGSTSTQVLLNFGANSGWHILVQGEYWRMFTSMFLHIGLPHLGFNSYALFIFGLEMERIYGSARFTTIYVLSGIFGSFASYASKGPMSLSAGASGAIFGIIGMNLVYFFLHREAFGQFGKQRISGTVLIIVINLIFGFTVPGIDNMAHMGGLVAGIILGYGLAPRYKAAGEYTGNLQLEDQTSLLNRWWVPAIAIAVLVFGIQMAEVFWLGGLGGV